MANFTSDFFENRGSLGLVQQNATTGALEVSGTQIANTYTVADETALQLIAKTSANDNLSVLVLSPGHYRRYNHASGMWLADNPFILFHSTYGTIATPTVSIAAGVTGATLFTLPVACTIPASMLRSGSIIGINAKISRTGTTAATPAYIYLGTGNTSSDSQVGAATLALTAPATSNIFPIIDFNATTSVLCVSGQAWGGGGSTDNGIRDRSTLINTAAAMYVNVGMGANKDTLDSFSLQALTVWVYKI